MLSFLAIYTLLDHISPAVQYCFASFQQANTRDRRRREYIYICIYIFSNVISLTAADICLEIFLSARWISLSQEGIYTHTCIPGDLGLIYLFIGRGYPRCLRSDMTGKIVEKIPVTMSGLLNHLQDSIYPEDDISSAVPTSMSIFNSESNNAYNQMGGGKKSYSFDLSEGNVNKVTLSRTRMH